jgi:hypothetical protein
VSGAKSRRKGHDFEREFCRWVRDHLGDKIAEFGRNLKQSYCAQEGDTDPLAGFLPECKAYSKERQGRAYKRDAWQQACAAAKKRGLEPLVIWKLPGTRDCKFVAFMRDPAHGDAEWSWGFEWRKEVEPPSLAAIVRERL